MNSPKPDHPHQPSDALRRLESLPASTAGGPPPSEPEPAEPPRRSGLRYALIAGGVALVGLLLWLALGGPIITDSKKKDHGEIESGLETARRSLAEQTDLSTCRNAITQINADLSREKELRPPTLSPGRRAELKAYFNLPDDALAEIDGTHYSKLDAAYLEQCLLFRDAGRSPGLSVPELRNRWLDRVRLAFAWTVRQVRLEEEPEVARRIDPLTLPPGYVLRRGVGSPLERALVFLALLEQLGPPEKVRGCLVFCPEKDDGEPTLWACGVLVEGKDDLYLFDPRLGLPLPGKDGKGIATLGGLIKEPALLQPLSDAGSLKYTPAGRLVSRARLNLVASLSGLAPRMKHLEEKVLGSAVPVRLAQDVEAARTAFTSAAKSAGIAAPVVAWSDGPYTGPELLRRFITESEGGSDRGQYLQLSPEAQKRFLLPSHANGRPIPFPRSVAWNLAAVPFEHYPRVFQNPERFPRTVGLGLRVYERFAFPFLQASTEVQAAMEGSQPRDLILRGRYTQAAPGLIRERDDRVRVQKAFHEGMARDPERMQKRFDTWVEEAIGLYARQVQAKEAGNTATLAETNRAIEKLWAGADVVALLLGAAQADPRLTEITYQVALCKQEMAEAAQTRLDLLAEREGGLTDSEQKRAEAEKKLARQAWQDALTWWDRYTHEHSNGPGDAAVRRLRARALTCLGNPAAAVALLRDTTPPMWPMEQIAATYLASRVRSRPE